MAGSARAEVLAEFIKGSTEANGTGERTKAAHRVVALFDRSIVLFEPIVQILAGPIYGLAADAATDGG